MLKQRRLPSGSFTTKRGVSELRTRSVSLPYTEMESNGELKMAKSDARMRKNVCDTMFQTRMKCPRCRRMGG